MRLFAIAAALGLASCGNTTQAPVEQRGNGAVAASPSAAPPAARATDVGANLAVADAPAASPSKDASAADFDAFWSRFRTAALAGDAAQIRALSRSTVQMHGLLDDSPVRQIASADIPAAVSAALAATDDASDNSPTVRSMFESHPHFAPGEVEGTGQVRFASFVFKPTAAGWRLAELYGEDE